MHILFISSWYPNKTNPTHGIFNKDFVKAASLNNNVSVIHVCSNENLINVDYETESFFDENIFNYFVYYKKIKSNSLFSNYLKLKKTKQYFEIGYKKITEQYGKPDIIQLNVVLPAGFGAMHLSKKYNIPLIINECWTGYMPKDGRYKGLLMKYFTKKIINHAKIILPVSESLKKEMQNHSLAANYSVVPNIISFKLKTNTASKNSKTFIHVSTLDDEQKNVSGILKAFAVSYYQNSTIQLNIIGAKPSENLLLLVKQLKLQSCVNFLGVLTKEELANEFENCLGLIMFSNYESFGVVIGESISFLKPVITSVCGGITERITAELGYQINPKNEKELSNAINHITNNPWQINKENAMRFINEFSLNSIAEKLNTIYKQFV
ncbi:MAG: glycosyltransferase [Bacteroidetes bacterium]|nr:glycosyltransferase [Bacteroidota bacterium]